MSTTDLSLYGGGGVTVAALERGFSGKRDNGAFESIDQQLSGLIAGGKATLSLYDYAGADPANPNDLYPEELLAIAGLAFLDQCLADEYFYDI